MQCHDHITRSRLFTNEFCSGVIPFLTEQIVVCLDYWKIFCRKCVENLVVTKKCVISLSLSLSLSGVARQYINYQLIFNGLAVDFSLFYFLSLGKYRTQSISPPFVVIIHRYTSPAVCGTRIFHARMSPFFLRISDRWKFFKF